MTERKWAEILSDGSIGNTIIAEPDFISNLNGEWVEYTDDDHVNRSGKYNKKLKKFILPKPFPKWKLGKDGEWQPPKQKPRQDPQLYDWDDKNNTWKVRGNRRIDN